MTFQLPQTATMRRTAPLMKVTMVMSDFPADVLTKLADQASSQAAQENHGTYVHIANALLRAVASCLPLYRSRRAEIEDPLADPAEVSHALHSCLPHLDMLRTELRTRSASRLLAYGRITELLDAVQKTDSMSRTWFHVMTPDERYRSDKFKEDLLISLNTARDLLHTTKVHRFHSLCHIVTIAQAKFRFDPVISQSDSPSSIARLLESLDESLTELSSQLSRSDMSNPPSPLEIDSPSYDRSTATIQMRTSLDTDAYVASAQSLLFSPAVSLPLISAESQMFADFFADTDSIVTADLDSAGHSWLQHIGVKP